MLKYQKDVLRALSGRIGGFYLAGGTALSLFYFQHRMSVDLDFFTDKFDYPEIVKTIEYLENTLNKKSTLVGYNPSGKTAGIAVYNIHFTEKEALKMDFVEDVVGLLKKTKTVDGIRILSLEDIYLRKLYALAGMIRISDETGRDAFIGGRASAKDFYDVYFLSRTFMPLSEFVAKYCNLTVTEAVIRWFRTYDRMAIMDGILGLAANKPPDCKAMERYFREEVDKILGRELGSI